MYLLMMLGCQRIIGFGGYESAIAKVHELEDGSIVVHASMDSSKSQCPSLEAGSIVNAGDSFCEVLDEIMDGSSTIITRSSSTKASISLFGQAESIDLVGIEFTKVVRTECYGDDPESIEEVSLDTFATVRDQTESTIEVDFIGDLAGQISFLNCD